MARKALGIIGQMLSFAAGVMIFIMVMLYVGAAGDQSIFNQKVNEDLESEAGEIKDRATLTAVLEDELWRAPGISGRFYTKKTASDILTLYYSSDSSNVWIDGNKVSASKVRSDLETYFKYKLDKIYVQEEEEKYSFTVGVEGGAGVHSPISLGSLNPISGTVVTTTLVNSNGDTIGVNLYTEREGSGS